MVQCTIPLYRSTTSHTLTASGRQTLRLTFGDRVKSVVVAFTTAVDKQVTAHRCGVEGIAGEVGIARPWVRR